MRPNFLRASLLAYAVPGVGDFLIRRLSIAELRNLDQLRKSDAFSAIAGAISIGLLNVDGERCFSDVEEVFASLDNISLRDIGGDIINYSNGLPLRSEAKEDAPGEAPPES